MHKFFEMQSPDDLLRKLEREYDRWKADPVNVDLAWNFFVTAEHLPDWIYYQDMPTSGTERPDLLDGRTPYEFKMAPTRPVLRICSHLANGAKHFHLSNPNLTSVGDTVREMAGYVKNGYVKNGYYAKVPMLRVRLTPQEQAALGLREAVADAIWLATQVLAFWQAKVP